MNKQSCIAALAFAVVSVVATSSTVFAGSLSSYQRVTGMQANSLAGSNPNFVIVSFDADLTSSPACASGNRNSITFDATTANGKTRLALFQAAMLSGKPVRVTGLNTCTGGIENLGWAGFAD